MKFKIPIYAFIEAKDEVEAMKMATIIRIQLGNPILKAALMAQGVRVLAHSVERPLRAT